MGIVFGLKTMLPILKILLIAFLTGTCAALYASSQSNSVTGLATLRFPAAGWSQVDLRAINTQPGSGLSGVWENDEEERINVLCWTDFPPLLDPPVTPISTGETVVLGQIVPLHTVSDGNQTFLIAGPFPAAQYECVVRAFNFLQPSFERFLGTLRVDADHVILPAE